MADILNAVVEPMALYELADFVGTVDALVVGRKYDIVIDPRIGSGSDDETAPTVDNFDPPAGTPISRTRRLGFDVKDNGTLRLTAVLVEFDGTSLYEVAWDGMAFSPLYADSTRTTVTGGHRYELRRTGGWPVAPTVRVVAIDTAGNEAT